MLAFAVEHRYGGPNYVRLLDAAHAFAGLWELPNRGIAGDDERMCPCTDTVTGCVRLRALCVA